MTALLLEPHNDDAALFAAFTCLEHQPRIVTVLRSFAQERYRPPIYYAAREDESRAASHRLGCEWEQWPYGDVEPPWEMIEAHLRRYGTARSWTRVFAPLVEENGHPHHNRVGELAEAVFGSERVSFYVTYRLHQGRSDAGRVVEPRSGMVAAKLRALACYESQCDASPTQHHFLHDLTERIVP